MLVLIRTNAMHDNDIPKESLKGKFPNLTHAGCRKDLCHFSILLIFLEKN